MVKLFNIFKKKPKINNNINTRDIANLLTYQETSKPFASTAFEGYSYEYEDGGKYFGGFGPTKLFFPDYYTMRARSDQLFKENLYARGIIRRLVTNEINTGLTPEVIPNEKVLGKEEGELGDWSELVEDRFALWAESSLLCDTTHQSDFGKIQRIIKQEAIITGDVLIVLRLDRITGLPRIQIISGANIISPIGTTKPLLKGVRIEYGVEINQFNQQIAYHVLDATGKTNRIPAFGPKSGRRIAWLVYGTDKRISEVRGAPLLSLIFQSLKEVDRYRDATQRKAAINAILAMFIKKDKEKVASKPITKGAVKKQNAEITELDGTQTRLNIAKHIPGLVIENLQVGEEPVAFGNQGIDTKFAEFEAAVIHAMAWANEIPPEILQLSFSSNYSASQAAINEFKNYLNKARAEFGATVCKPIYKEWFISEILSQKIQAIGFLDAWTDPTKYDILNAWLQTDWTGAIKPSTDIRKQAQGYSILVNNGWMTNSRAAKELTGTKFSRNIRIIKRENEEKAQAGINDDVSALIPRNENAEDEEKEDE